jgi:acyl-CoA thioesterase-1
MLRSAISVVLIAALVVGLQSAFGQTSATKAVDTRPVIVCFGDSLTAGYGVPRGDALPSLLQQKLDAEGYSYRVVNAGLSGDTTSGGLVRLSRIQGMLPAVVLLELGANDGLRGTPLSTTRANLSKLITGLKQVGAKVVLAGMTLPRNYGGDFISKFESMYASLAKEHGVPLLPFELEPLAEKGLLQSDGLHPTAEGYRAVLPRIFAGLSPVLAK